MALRGMLLQQLLLLLGLIILAASQPTSNCKRSCGNVDIPYPFGTEEGCYLDKSFLITCDTNTSKSKPLLRSSNVTVLNISLDGELRVSYSIARDCYNESGVRASETYSGLNLTKFAISFKKNKFTAVGCDTVALIQGFGEKDYATGCISLCDNADSVDDGSCSGIGCCQTSIPAGVSDFFVGLGSLKNHPPVLNFNPCSFGFVVEETAYNFSSSDLKNLGNTDTVPVVLDWAVGNETCQKAKTNSTSYACKAENSACYESNNGPGYRCKCSPGFQGNPYLPYGCLDIDECKTSNPCYKD
uniref:Wall-associated receptor kinase galacturonan-binding domain-containing protein n=1 Tax=Quercus lobata TaxID=97700 RepID=A0A7N2MLU4_QUELO